MTIMSTVRSVTGTMRDSTIPWSMRPITRCIWTRVRKDTTPTWSVCSSTSSYEGVMTKAMHLRRTRSAGVAATTGALVMVAALGFSPSPAGARYTDLRRIEPIHGDVTAGERKATVCHACHGVGAPVAPTFPRLAGQRPDYLYHRLVLFKTASLKDPYYSVSPMRSLVTNLSDADMRDMAVYFAAQTPTAGTVIPAPAATAAKGEALFLAGDPGRGIPPCQGCHGT